MIRPAAVKIGIAQHIGSHKFIQRDGLVRVLSGDAPEMVASAQIEIVGTRVEFAGVDQPRPIGCRGMHLRAAMSRSI